MTRGHRRVHLVIWLFIGPLAAAAVLLALGLRPASPIQPTPAPGSAAAEVSAGPNEANP